MKKMIMKAGCFLIRLIWRLRYRITYEGLEEVKEALEDEKNGTLFLPNHPAIFIDPLVVSVPLLPHFPVRPLIVEYMFYHPLVNWIAKFIDALPVPNFHTSFNTIKKRRTEKTFRLMSEGLQKGECFLIYPSGTTKQGPREVLGGAFGAHQLISENKNAKIVLIRMEGLWGSIFSRALTDGDVPDMDKAVKRSIWIILKNLIFFTPRRDVKVTFEIAADDLPRDQGKTALNSYLERWYNKPFDKKGEPLKLVSYSFWREELPQVAKHTEEEIPLSSVPKKIKEEVIEKVAELAKREKEEISVSMQLLADLGLDSLDLAEILAFLEERYDVRGIHPGELTTVSRLFLIAMKIYEAPEVQEHEWNLRRWKRELPEERVLVPDGQTIPEVFLRICDHKLFDIAAADPKSGLVSYRKIKMKALLLSDVIRKFKKERIGILLPSSVAVEVLVLACHFAGKTPVMINWTVGGNHLDTVIEVADIDVVLTSWAFVDNLENADISQLEDMLIYLEELRTTISLWDMIRSECLSFLSSSKILALPKFAHLDEPKGNKEAVILFTSGTEAQPKGVPLSHKNILSNQRAALETLEFSSNDRILSILPAFHSFGFTVTGLMPLLAGLKVVYYPNPMENKRLVKAIHRWGVTIFPGAPTFLKNVMQASDRKGVNTLRYIFSGAERAPKELFDLALKLCPKAKITEGYGITECSPVLSINVEGCRECGVGKAIPGVQLRIVNPETYEPLEVGQVGLVLASGPNVFCGYLNKPKVEPFVEIGGSNWYQTGDLGKLDPDGNLILSGRKKRFVKVGGEMLSLAAMEEAIGNEILEKYKDEVNEELPQVVVSSLPEENGRPKLVLFTTKPFEVFEVNHILRQKGFSNLFKIDKVCEVDAIPVGGTGKIAYRELDKMLESYA